MANHLNFERETMELMRRGSWELLEFASKGDHRGELVALQRDGGIPFDIKRVYYLVKTKTGVVRGLHAHKDLDQVLVAVSGSCRVSVDDGTRKEAFTLNSPQKGLRITNLVWREMDEFSHDCVLLVVASDIYRERDYIRNYAEFLRFLAAGTMR